MKQRRCWVGGVPVMAAACAIVLVLFTATSGGAGAGGGFGFVRFAAAKGLPLPAGRMDLRSPGRDGVGNRLPAWVSAAPEDCRCARGHQAVRYAPDAARLGIFSQDGARRCFGRTLDTEYQQELQGIADGVKAHGGDLDVYDIVALKCVRKKSRTTTCHG